VQDYNIALAKHVAQLGADEIQFDYVRFPAEGDQKDASFAYQSGQPEATQPEPKQDSTGNETSANGASGNDGSGNDSCGDGRLGRPAEAKQGGPGTTAKAAVPSPKSPAEPALSERSAPKGAIENSPALQRRVAPKSGNKSRRDDRTAACRVPRGPQRSDVITAFLKKAYAELHPTGVLLSLDVFGVMAWQRQVDLSHTGQDIVGMAHYCDVLSP